METKINKDGRVTIPASMRKECEMELNVPINITVENKKIVLTTDKTVFLINREIKLQQIEQMFKSGTIDLKELGDLIKEVK